jgi:hypothetical protein
MGAVAVPPLIFVVCLAAGVYASSRWLPELAPGRVGGIAFFAVCGLLGAAAAVLGLDIYGIVENLSDGFAGLDRRRIFADGLESLLWQTGVLVALALAVYLLAPPGEDADASLVSGADPGPGSA